MKQTVILNDDLKIEATNLYTDEVVDPQSGKKRKTVHVDFKVTSEDYHRVATFFIQKRLRRKRSCIKRKIPCYHSEIHDIRYKFI